MSCRSARSGPLPENYRHNCSLRQPSHLHDQSATVEALKKLKAAMDMGVDDALGEKCIAGKTTDWRTFKFPTMNTAFDMEVVIRETPRIRGTLIPFNSRRFIDPAGINERYLHRLEAGPPNLLGIIGLSLGIDYLRGKDLIAIHKEEMGLLDRLCTGLSEIAGIELYGGADLSNRLPLLAVNLQGVTPEDIGTILDADFNIAVRVGLHCAPLVHETLGTAQRGAVRFSLGHFNTAKDIDRTIEAMALIAKIHG